MSAFCLVRSAVGGIILLMEFVAATLAQDGPVMRQPSGELRLYVAPDSPAAQQAKRWRVLRPIDAEMMDYLAAQPVGQWFGSETKHLFKNVRTLMEAATADHSLVVLVAYNIPERDCGGYSAGGAPSDTDYISWIQTFADAIGDGKVIVILEPDALLETDCLSAAKLRSRFNLIAEAVTILKKNPYSSVYIDAGNPSWVSAEKIVSRLKKAGIEHADGFSLNVSNFESTEKNIAYGSEISQSLGDKHFVIDTSRNGLGSNGEWCNPPGRAVGREPTLSTGRQLVDAYLWIKLPGGSDGECHGGPAAGEWWASYGLNLVRISRLPIVER
jgi:endoglucanase